jgi:hypothetical protein
MKRTINTLALVLALSATCIGQTIAGLDPDPPKVVAPVALLRVQATVELKTGERIDGQFAQISVEGALFETAGQTMTIPLDRIRAIYFGKAPAPPEHPAKAELEGAEASVEQQRAAKMEEFISKSCPARLADDRPDTPTNPLSDMREKCRVLQTDLSIAPVDATLTREEAKLGALTRQQAYNVAVNCVTSRLKVPSTARFSNMNDAVYTVERERVFFGIKGKQEFVHVRLLVDAQNSFGAMLRERWLTQISMDGLRCLCISLR